MSESQPTQPKREAHCPACNTLLTKGMKHCPECGMEVAKMKEYILAMQHAKKRAAEQKKSGGTAVAPMPAARKIVPVGQMESGEERAKSGMNRELLRAGVWVLVIIAAIAGGVTAYQKLMAPGEPWRAYPTDPRALLVKFIQIVHTDTLKEHDKAYDLISLQRRDEKDTKQKDDYMQLFHDMHKYYSTLFGDNYVNEVRFEPENGNTDTATTWIGRIRNETMTIDIEPQTPADKKKSGQPEHWGIVAIREFPLGNSSRSRQIGGIEGMLKGIGAGGSARQIQGIAGLGTDLSRMTPAEIKQMLLPIITDPRATGLTQNIYRTWVVRKDQTVRDALQQITEDPRYSQRDQEVARQVLTDKAPEEELIAVGVTDTGR